MDLANGNSPNATDIELASDFLALGDVLSFFGGLIAFIGNAMMLLLFYKNRKLVRKPGIDAILPLSASDMFTGLGILLACIHRRLCTWKIVAIPPKMAILAYSGEIQAGSSTSLLLAVAIAFDRLWAINWPYRFLRSDHNKVVWMWSIPIVTLTIGLQLTAYTQAVLYYGYEAQQPPEFFTSIGLWRPWYLLAYSGLMVVASLTLTILFICVMISMIFTERRMNRLFSSINSQRFRMMEQQHITSFSLLTPIFVAFYFSIRGIGPRLSATAIFVCVIFVTIPYLSWEFLTRSNFLYGKNIFLTAYGSLLSAAMAMNATLNMVVYALRYQPIKSGLISIVKCQVPKNMELRRIETIATQTTQMRSQRANSKIENDPAPNITVRIRQRTLT